MGPCGWGWARGAEPVQKADDTKEETENHEQGWQRGREAAEVDWACVAEGHLDGAGLWWQMGPPQTPHPLRCLCSLVLAQEHLSVSHNNLTTLHGELSSLPSLRVSADEGHQAWRWGLEGSQRCEGRARPKLHQYLCLSPYQAQGPVPKGERIQ